MIHLQIYFCLILLFTVNGIFSVYILSQSKLNWRVRNKNNSIDIAAIVPGGIYSDLMNAKIIDNVYKDFNDVNTRWVGQNDWIYYTNFYISETDFKSNQGKFLTYHGLDTFATLFLNNKRYDTTKNMFHQIRFNVNSTLKVGVNNLTLVFESPIITALKYFNNETERRGGKPVTPLCTPPQYNGECHVNHIRKQQASFSWDWGPAFPSVGIWRDAFIELYNGVLIRNVEVHLKPIYTKKIWTVHMKIHLESFAKNILNGKLEAILYHYSNKDHKLTTELELNKLIVRNNGRKTLELTLTVPEEFVELWWPNGLGKQILYLLQINAACNGEMNEKTIKIGFRTIKLIQRVIAVNTSGLTFYFEVNNKPMFMKGSNWIPSDILPEVASTDKGMERIKYLLTSAKIANMNMLRVWGGGVYESDYFYTLTDELGILIWQDFMFACAMYPANKQFLKNVRTEVEQQIERLQYHPSIAIWAGNNENELALRQNWYSTIFNFDLFKREYVDLYVNTIRETVQRLDNTRPFVTSSPSNGIESDQSGFVAENPASNYFGDVHPYIYFGNTWNHDVYPIPRFASEYGFQSLPNYRTMQDATSNELNDLQVDSEFLKHRQHYPLGYLPINTQIELHFLSFKKQSLKMFIYQSQIVQAMSMKVETENNRHFKDTLLKNGEGFTMGSLYWQLNDVWAAPSWSSIDFNGHWKMLHYYAKNFFAPILVSGVIDENILKIYVSSDLLVNDTKQIAKLTVIVYDVEKFNRILEFTKNITIIHGKSFIYHEMNIKQFNNGNDKIIILRLQSSNTNEELSPENFVLLCDFNEDKNIPSITHSIQNTTDKNIFKLKLKTDTFAPFVWLQTDNIPGYFSDNGLMLIDDERTILFYANKEITTYILDKALTISSLRNTTQLL